MIFQAQNHHHPDARPADSEHALDTLDGVGIGGDDAWIGIGAATARLIRGLKARRLALAAGEEVGRELKKGTRPKPRQLAGQEATGGKS